jgi:arylsulfatase A-like enzyme
MIMGRALGASVAVALIAMLGAVRPAVAAAGPNVLVIVTDDQRAQGTLAVMPATRRYFHRGGTSFSKAVATTPLCCPSRVSILSGQYAHNHGVFHNSANSDELEHLDYSSLLPRYLQDAGYETGIVGKYLNGWDLARQPPNFDDYAITDGDYLQTSWDINGQPRTVSTYSTRFVGRLAARFLKLQEGHDGRPWFLYVAPSAAHGTFGQGPPHFDPERRYAHAKVGPSEPNPATRETNLADKPPFWQQIVREFPPGTDGLPNAHQTRRGQLRLLMSADDMVGHIFNTLRKEGETHRTLAIFISDNGLLWGEHGDVPIKDMPWLPAIKIPLAMRWPGHVRAGHTDARLAANIDLAPTVLDAVGLPVPPTMDGRSLLQPWLRSRVLVEYGGFSNGRISIPRWSGLYAPGNYEYAQYYTPTDSHPVTFQEYYDLRSDPWELHNVLGDSKPANDPADLRALARRLAAAQRCAGSSCP